VPEDFQVQKFCLKMQKRNVQTIVAQITLTSLASIFHYLVKKVLVCVHCTVSAIQRVQLSFLRPPIAWIRLAKLVLILIVKVYVVAKVNMMHVASVAVMGSYVLGTLLLALQTVLQTMVHFMEIVWVVVQTIPDVETRRVNAKELTAATPDAV
jgi:hypothetical protein